MRFLSEDEIEEAEFARLSKERAKNLKVALDYRGAKNVGFKVRDSKKDTVRHVIYHSEKKEPQDWSCDCKWHATRGTFGKYCAHILAVHIFLRRMVEKNE
ncbi:MAG: hypothetical protein KAT35_04875 [Candidatus Aenigmarchaeota archaeon]|nr:hypothetical protein [Candidatus Aenigmarchaeota archaeon]